MAAAVEGEERRIGALQLRGHHHEGWIDREMHNGALREKDVARIPIAPVLSHRVMDVLSRKRVLQLGRRDGQAVAEEDEVESFDIARVVELSRDAQSIGRVKALEVGVKAGGWAEVCEVDVDAEIVNAVTEGVDGAAFVDLLGETIGEALLCGVAIAVELDEAFPSVVLGGSDEREELDGVETEAGAVVSGGTLLPAVGEQMVLDRIFESPLFGSSNHRFAPLPAQM
jgi:hypothetical protein